MADQHTGFVEGLTSPADNAAAVTPSDSTDLAFTSRALYVGGAGNIVVIDVPINSATPWLQLSGSFDSTGAAHSAIVELYSGINRPPTQAENQVVVA